MGKSEEERVVVPVIAEQPHIEKRAVPHGGVRVSKRVEENVEHVDVPLIREDVDVERRAINRVVDERPEARIEDGVTVVPVVEEVMQRRFLVREEVRIGRHRTEGRAVADVPLVREQVTIEKLAADAEPLEQRAKGTARAPEVNVSNRARSTRSFPVGVLVLLVVVAIALIALIAAIF
jgi:uncharacterized protein (TIGR02271 family)